MMLEAAANADSQVNAEEALQLFSYLFEALEDRRDHPRDDMLTRIVQLEFDGRPLTEDELLGITFLVAVAGHETTVGAIGALLLPLADPPEIRAGVIPQPRPGFPPLAESPPPD